MAPARSGEALVSAICGLPSQFDTNSNRNRNPLPLCRPPRTGSFSSQLASSRAGSPWCCYRCPCVVCAAGHYSPQCTKPCHSTCIVVPGRERERYGAGTLRRHRAPSRQFSQEPNIASPTSASAAAAAAAALTVIEEGCLLPVERRRRRMSSPQHLFGPTSHFKTRGCCCATLAGVCVCVLLCVCVCAFVC